MATRLEDKAAGLRQKGGRVVSDKRSRAAKPKKVKPTGTSRRTDPFGGGLGGKGGTKIITKPAAKPKAARKRRKEVIRFDIVRVSLL